MQERHRGTCRNVMSTKLHPEAADYIRSEAERRGVTTSHYIADVLERHVQRRNPEWRGKL